MVPRQLSGNAATFDVQTSARWLYGLQRFGIKLGLENIQAPNRRAKVGISFRGAQEAAASSSTSPALMVKAPFAL